MLNLFHETRAHQMKRTPQSGFFCFIYNFLLLLLFEKALIDPAPLGYHVQDLNSNHSNIVRLLLLLADVCCNANTTEETRKPGAVQKFFGSEAECLIMRKIWKFKSRCLSLTALGMSTLSVSRYILIQNQQIDNKILFSITPYSP